MGHKGNRCKTERWCCHLANNIALAECADFDCFLVIIGYSSILNLSVILVLILLHVESKIFFNFSLHCSTYILALKLYLICQALSLFNRKKCSKDFITIQ